MPPTTPAVAAPTAIAGAPAFPAAWPAFPAAFLSVPATPFEDAELDVRVRVRL
jgi:hypothetical protein